LCFALSWSLWTPLVIFRDAPFVRQRRSNRQFDPRHRARAVAFAALVEGLATSPLRLYPAFGIQVIAYAIIYTWLYNNTRGSLLLG
jgi:hypothetical protein